MVFSQELCLTQGSPSFFSSVLAKQPLGSRSKGLGLKKLGLDKPYLLLHYVLLLWLSRDLCLLFYGRANVAVQLVHLPLNLICSHLIIASQRKWQVYCRQTQENGFSSRSAICSGKKRPLWMLSYSQSLNLSLWSDHSSQSFCSKTPDCISGPCQTGALD